MKAIGSAGKCPKCGNTTRQVQGTNVLACDGDDCEWSGIVPTESTLTKPLGIGDRVQVTKAIAGTFSQEDSESVAIGTKGIITGEEYHDIVGRQAVVELETGIVVKCGFDSVKAQTQTDDDAMVSTDTGRCVVRPEKVGYGVYKNGKRIGSETFASYNEALKRAEELNG